MRHLGSARFLVLALSFAAATAAASTQPTPAPHDDGSALDVRSFAGTLRQARAASDAEKWKEAAPLWTAVVGINPLNAMFWGQLARARFWSADYRGAIEAYSRTLDLGGDTNGPALAAYRIAASHAQLGEKEEAIAWLRRALDMGYASLDGARKDEALKPVRDDPRVRQMLALQDVSKLSRVEGWRFDLRLLAREALRKGFLVKRSITPQQFEAKVKELDSAIPTLSDWDIVLGLMRLVVLLDDGHSALWDVGDNPWFGAALPLQLYWFEEGPVVLAADPEYRELVGAQVLAVDGHPVDQVLAALLPYVNRDRGNARIPRMRAAYRMRNAAFLHAVGMARSERALTLTVRDLHGTTRDVTVAADKSHPDIWNVKPNPPQWVSYASTLAHPPLYVTHMEKPYWFEYLPEQKAVFFAYNQVVPDEKEPIEQFTSKLFDFIDTHEVDKLVIDMRWNNGGDTFVGQPLLRALLADRKVNQRGKLFVIIGQRTYSAAQNMATYFERFANPIFVGEPTGSSPSFVGEEDPVTLPYSKLLANVSNLYWQSSWPRDERMWLAPDILVLPTWADYKAGRDAALEAALAYPEQP